MSSISVLAKLAKAGAKIERHRMCKGCAFKEGGAANLEDNAVQNAKDALLTPGGVFMCHVDESRTCGGFLMASSLQSREVMVMNG